MKRRFKVLMLTLILIFSLSVIFVQGALIESDTGGMFIDDPAQEVVIHYSAQTVVTMNETITYIEQGTTPPGGKENEIAKTKTDAKNDLKNNTNYSDASIDLIVDKGIGSYSYMGNYKLSKPFSQINEKDVKGNYIWSEQDILDYLNNVYLHDLGDDAKRLFPQYIEGRYNRYELNFKMLREKGIVVWGTPQDVERETRQVNDKKGEEYRFLGLSRDNTIPVSNMDFPPDKLTSTSYQVYKRSFIEEPWNNAHKIQNNRFEPNEESGFWMSKQFENLRLLWHQGDEDHYYSTLHTKYNEFPNWDIEDSNQNKTSNFTYMNIEKRDKVFLITMPPTHITKGTMVEWHGANGGYYETFQMDTLKYQYDFALENLELKDDGTVIADVRYEGVLDIANGYGVPLTGTLDYTGAINGTKNVDFTYSGGFNPNEASWAKGGEIDIFQTRRLTFKIPNFPKSNVGNVDYTLSLTVNPSAFRVGDEKPLDNNSNMAMLSLNNGALVPTSEDSVPEWRLSKYWNNLSPTPTSANFSLSVSRGNDGYSLNSGSAIFNAVSPNLSSTPWAFSTARILDGKNSAYFSTGNLSSSFFVGGDLLAVKANNSVDNIKLANWVKSNPANLQGVITSTNKGSSSTTSLVEKNHIFDYDVSTSKSFTYKKKYWDTDEDGEVYYYSTGPHTAGKNSTPASYDKTIKFNRFLPASSTTASTFSSTKDTNTNGMYWETGTSSTSLKVNPEVFMAYSDTAGATKGAFVAGDYLREIKPVYYNSAKFTNVNVKPSVTGTSTATDSRARTLASSLGAGGNAVIYKGSAIASSYVVDGQIELKTYALDVGDSALKSAWGNAGYSTDAINNDFLSKYATKNASTGKWEVTLDTTGRMKINGVEYGGTSNKLKATQTSQKVNTYNLVIRGGKLVSVNGNSNLNSLSQELKDALQRMNISTSNNVFDSFESGKGASLDETNVATVGNSLRGTNDLAVGKGWYNEDTTSLVVKEYVNTFKLPSYMSVDKIPMQIPGLEAPINKNLFFSKGYTGHTTLKMQVNDAWMKFDSSINGFGGNRSINYVVPNVSVLDTFN